MAWSTPKTYSVGAVLTAADLNTYQRDNLNYLYGAAGTFSPTLTQSGSVTLTTATGRYFHIGYRCMLHIFLDLGGTGTTSNDLVVGAIPAAIAPKSSGTLGSATDTYTGTGYYFDSGTTNYTIVPFFDTSSTLRFRWTGSTGTTNMGSGPAFAAAAADSLIIDIFYETASPAT